MKTWLIIGAILVLAVGCSDSSKREDFEDYVVEFPNVFQRWTHPSPTTKRWATQDGIIQIDSYTEGKPRKDFDSVAEFQTWLESELEITRPNFFLSASGIRMALSTTEDQSQVVIIHPSHETEWRALVFHISAGEDDYFRIREIRELAIAAITSGKFTPR